MSDDRQGGGLSGDQTDVPLDEKQASPPAATPVATVTPSAGLAVVKTPSAPPPPAGVAPPPKGAIASVTAPASEGSAPEPAPVNTVEPAPKDLPTAPAAPAAAPAPAAVTGDGIHVLFSGMTSVGLVREHNEDNLVIADLGAKVRHQPGETIASTVSASGLMFAVCDGMGGAAAGEVASQMAVDFLFDDLTQAAFDGDRDTLARHLVSTVERAGKQIFDTAQADRSRRGMGTTSTVAVLLDQILFIAQVGDSRAYVLRNGALKQVTKDQSLVNQLIEAGHLTEEEAEGFEHSNVILQALGTTEKVQVDLTFVELRQGDRLMMCSDGLSGLVRADTIAETLRTIGDPIACCARLTELANEGSGHDNITIIVADFSGATLSPPQSGETAAYNQYPLLPEGVAAPSLPATGGEAARAPGRADAAPARAGAGLWWAMGMVAILLGVGLAWWWEGRQETVPEAAPEQIPTVAPDPGSALGIPQQLPEPELVPAHISTDAETGLLVIDGEPRGPIAVGAPRDLDLAPGSYRVELQIEGSVAVSQVVAVESGRPLDVELRLPTGETGAQERNDEVAPEPVVPVIRRPRPGPAEAPSPQPVTKAAPVAPAAAPTPPTPATTPTAPVSAPRATASPRPTVTTAPTPTPPVSAPSNDVAAPAKRALPANPF